MVTPLQDYKFLNKGCIKVCNDTHDNQTPAC